MKDSLPIDNNINEFNQQSTSESFLTKEHAGRGYLYTIKYTTFEESLCNLEMKYLFGSTPATKSFFSSSYVDPSRSPFIKQCISVIYKGSSVEDISKQIVSNQLSYDNFKVSCMNLNNGTLSFEERREIEGIIGFDINGEADVHNPEVVLGIARFQEEWFFGELKENEGLWKLNDLKPYSYCNALSVRNSRAIVNIAVGNNLNLKVIDPCCGIGTIVIEALSQGIDIKGYELNPLIAENARKNLAFLGYPEVIQQGDMHEINEKFQVAIVDLPYGVFSLTTLEKQVDIIKTTRRIAERMVLVSINDMDEHIAQCGFSIVDKCQAAKGKFIRYITVCK